MGGDGGVLRWFCAGVGLRGSLDCKQERGGIYMIAPRKHSSYYTIASSYSSGSTSRGPLT